MTDTKAKTGRLGSTASGQLIILRPKNLVPGLNPEYVVERFPATIGRHPVNDVGLPFDSISRYHARLEMREGKPHLIDLGSSNGTYVNGQRVQIAPVADQDAVSFGSLEFTILIGLAPVASPASSEAPRVDEKPSLAVQFVMQDDQVQTVYHTELPDDTTRAEFMTEEITDPLTFTNARHRLISLYRLQDVLRSSSDEERLMQNVLDLLFEVLPVDRGAVLMRDDQDTAVFRPLAVKVKDGLKGDQIGISKTILQRCLKENVAVLTRDASLDDRFMAAESVVAGQMRSVMCVPLLSAHQTFGFFHLDTVDSVRSFSEEDLTFLAHVGQEVALHLQNLRMIQERILSERMAAIGQTITGMAHNIKNILVLSQGGVEMMEKRLHNRNYESLDETWTIVRRGVDRINKLVQEMLDYSRARKVEKRRADLNVFLAELHQAFAEEMTRRGVDWRLALTPGIPPLMLDIDGLEKALANLIVNAMEAGEDMGGKIELRARMAGEGSVVLEVEDQAGGIPREILPRIFVPFFTTKGSKGSGLGLAMTRKIIEDMGGAIDVDTRESQGTRFTITLKVGPTSPRLSQPRVMDHTTLMEE